MLRRSFLQTVAASPLLVPFPWLGRRCKAQISAELPAPTPGFSVFIPAKTRANHEELRIIACNAALEIAAFETAASELAEFREIQMNRRKLYDGRLEYIRHRDPAIYRAVLVELKAIRANGEVWWGEDWSNTGCVGPAVSLSCPAASFVRRTCNSPDTLTILSLKQASFRQKIKEEMHLMGGEQTFNIVRRSPEGGESAHYHIDVPEQADRAIEHIDRVEDAFPDNERGLPQDLHLRNMCEWFRNGVSFVPVSRPPNGSVQSPAGPF